MSALDAAPKDLRGPGNARRTTFPALSVWRLS